ncbi:hypothetical protein T03_3271 [Trichinella britovi]|uniref:Uncharacterized protein n=1 Tax=Trichinella britovi TaxID=45882 RepID=A0A0V1C472_TRIBR|nr:hypothetical protein T03_3271 [Trichinella britovi]
MTYEAHVEPYTFQLMFVVSSYFQSNNHNVDELKIMRRGYRFSMWGSDSILESIVECGGRT